MKIVINRRHSGFGLSEEAISMISAVKGILVNDYTIDRSDPDLVAVVENLGEKSWGSWAELKVVEIPDDVIWEIGEYDGMEWVREVSRVWE